MNAPSAPAPSAAAVRFAPSPTGRLHIGNARTALFNWLFAKPDGVFVLRLDDTDEARSTEAFARGIVEDLAWLGVRPDRTVRQSERRERYDRAADALRTKGVLYACYDTPEELDQQRRRLQARRRPPIYDRRALRLSDDERAALQAEGRRPHWRFLLPNHDGDPFAPRRTDVAWDDAARGPQSIDIGSMSDPVLVREDGSYLYTLPSVLDDAELGITHVIRGDDHVTNTAAQIALFEALGHAPPRFGHHNLLGTLDGEGLSKRKASLSLAALREDGFEPMAVASVAVQIGMAGQVEAKESFDDLGRGFRMEDASHSLARFDPAELASVNAEIVHALPFDAVRERLAALGIEGEGAEAFWDTVRANCERVRDAADWWRAINRPEDAELDEGDREFVRRAIDLLPPGAVTPETWGDWVAAIKEGTDRKGRRLFMPLRIALTGRDHGPELADLLPLIGREGIEARRP